MRYGNFSLLIFGEEETERIAKKFPSFHKLTALDFLFLAQLSVPPMAMPLEFKKIYREKNQTIETKLRKIRLC